MANSEETPEECKNKRVALALYKAFSSRDVSTVHALLPSHLEWWYHGPPSHQFMKLLLTGNDTASSDKFQFTPQSITAIGSIVLVEGCDQERSISWVHAWTVADGVITQVREYFNTSLTVTRFGNGSGFSGSVRSLHCPCFLWESSVSNRVGKSVPGLVLAI